MLQYGIRALYYITVKIELKSKKINDSLDCTISFNVEWKLIKTEKNLVNKKTAEYKMEKPVNDNVKKKKKV